MILWIYKRKASTPKVEAPSLGLCVHKDVAYPGADRIGIFYFRLFLLSRKASNAMTKPPKETSKAKIPIKTVMIS